MQIVVNINDHWGLLTRTAFTPSSQSVGVSPLLVPGVVAGEDGAGGAWAGEAAGEVSPDHSCDPWNKEW